jgi:tetratricopeptide (TPR) repeat protein
MEPDNPDLATTLDNLAVVLASQDKFEEAEGLYRRSLALREKTAIANLNNLAMVLEGKGQNIAAERQYKLAVTLADRMPAIPGSSASDGGVLVKMLQNYAALLRKLKRDAEAKKIEERVKALTK